MEDRELLDFLLRHAETISDFMEVEVAETSEEDLAHVLGESWFANPDWNEPGYRFRGIGQDGTGGHFAVWIRPGVQAPHPVVFFGSEGEHGVLTESLEAWVRALAHAPGVDHDPELVSLDVDQNWKLQEDPDGQDSLARYRDAMEAELGFVPEPAFVLGDVQALNVELCAWVAKVLEPMFAAAAVAAEQACSARRDHDEAVVAALAGALTCPECGSAALRYLSGMNGAAVGCRGCGRSFDPVP